MFLSDDGNTAVFPMPSGDFNIEEMTSRTHFEVNGDGIAAIPTVSQSPGDNGLALAPVVQQPFQLCPSHRATMGWP